MSVNLTIKNYRCFAEPATIAVNTGFTAFTGVNNAGKSALMRFILEFRPLFERIQDRDQFVESFVRLGHQFQPIHVMDPLEVFSNLNNNDIEFWFDFKYGQEIDPRTVASRVHFTIDRNLRWKTKIFVSDSELPVVRDWSYRIKESVIFMNGGERIDVSELFKVVHHFSDSLYIGPFRNTINVGTQENYLDIQIGQSFIRQYRELKTGSKKSDNTAITKVTKDISAIFGFQNFNVEPSVNDQSLHITINDQPYKQHELGSGLLQFILVFANSAIRRPSLILMDEPELNLHPSLQLDFLTTLATYSKSAVWFSTHSLGLARAAAENIYVVLQESDGNSRIRLIDEIPRLSEFLGEMSFSSHKELGFEKVLLVEGPTDIKTIQQMLRKQAKDHKVLILTLFGRINGEMREELEEILRITPHISIIIDSERSDESEPLSAERQEFTRLCEQMGIPVHVLEYRATENYFSDDVVKAVFGESYRALGPYESLREVEPRWGKKQNWKLAHAMSRESIADTDLGKFLESL